MHVCENYAGGNYCGEDPQPIARKISGCTGKEATIKECNTEKVNDCNHKLDAIVICLGVGDATGKSQKSDVGKAGATPLGKLPLPPIFNLECSDAVSGNAGFLGDEGSTFVAKCPKGCKSAPGIVQGTSIFRGDSSICLSAVHSGVI